MLCLGTLRPYWGIYGKLIPCVNLGIGYGSGIFAGILLETFEA